MISSGDFRNDSPEFSHTLGTSGKANMDRSPGGLLGQAGAEFSRCETPADWPVVCGPGDYQDENCWCGNKFPGNELVLLDTGRTPSVPGFPHVAHVCCSAPTSVRDLDKRSAATDSLVQSSTCAGLGRNRKGKESLNTDDYSTRSGTVAELGFSRSVAGGAHDP